MHSPMKNQQAISVTTTAFTATSFMEAYGRRGDFSDIWYKRSYSKQAALQGKLSTWAHLKVRASLVRLPTPLTMPPTSAEGTSSTLKGDIEDIERHYKDDCIAAISSWPTLARAANLVTSLRTNLSQARAAFISAMTHSENQVLLNVCKLSSFQFSFNITPIRYGFLKYVHWIYQNESSCVQLFPHHLGLSSHYITLRRQS